MAPKYLHDYEGKYKNGLGKTFKLYFRFDEDDGCTPGNGWECYISNGKTEVLVLYSQLDETLKLFGLKKIKE